MATGIVNAGGSFGQFVLAPVAVGLTALLGWMGSMQALGLVVLLALPAAWVLKGNSNAVASAGGAPTAPRLSARAAIKQAMNDRSFLLLLIRQREV